jgi:hypothetical protein
MQRTDEPEPQHSPTQADSGTVINTPATIQACQADYETGTQERHGLDNIARRQHGNR